MKIATTIFFLLTWFSIVTETPAQSEKPIARITAWGMHYGGKIQYQYHVENLSRGQIRRLTLGLAGEDQGESRELSVRPDHDRGPDSFVIPVRGAGRPDGWVVLYSYEDENPKFAIDWIEDTYRKSLFPQAPDVAHSAPPDAGSRGIQPGAIANNFSVFLPRIDPAYVNAHAWLDSGDESQIVRVIKGDTMPPNLNIVAERVDHPGRHNGWVEFVLHATSQDNYDPNPEISLDTITGNHAVDTTADRQLGKWRVRFKNTHGQSYRLRFRSIDASGNQTVKNFDYVAQKNPHRNQSN